MSLKLTAHSFRGGLNLRITPKLGPLIVTSTAYSTHHYCSLGCFHPVLHSHTTFPPRTCISGASRASTLNFFYYFFSLASFDHSTGFLIPEVITPCYNCRKMSVCRGKIRQSSRSAVLGPRWTGRAVDSRLPITLIKRAQGVPKKLFQNLLNAWEIRDLGDNLTAHVLWLLYRSGIPPVHSRLMTTRVIASLYPAFAFCLF